MFNSETYGRVEFPDIADKLLEFYNRTKQYDTGVQIVVGTDSQNHHSTTKIVTVIAIICEGHGGIYFYEVSNQSKITDVRQKLYTETQMSLQAADELLAMIEAEDKYNEMYEMATFTIHVDAGHSPDGKTRELIPAIVGWIRSQGYEYEVKPDSFVASTIADRISK